jgi:hypothetical protein
LLLRQNAWQLKARAPVVSDFAQKTSLTIDLSRVLPDLVQVDERTKRMVLCSLETFFGTKK